MTSKNKNKKTTAFLLMLGVFFQIKPLQAPFLPKFPQLARKELNKNKTSSKKRSVLFCEIKAYTAILRRYSSILPKFQQILPGFSPNQKYWG